jgi:hypothetical protein
MLRHIDPRLIRDLADWQVLLALHQDGWNGLITLDYQMLPLPRELAVIHDTNLTLVAIEAAAHSPLRALGQLLTHAPHIAKAFDATKPQVFRLTRTRAVSPIGAWDELGRIASGDQVALKQLYAQARLSRNALATRILN